MPTKSPNKLTPVLIEVTLKHTATSNHNDIDRRRKVRTNSPKDLPNSALDLVSTRCAFFYLRCYSDGKSAFVSLGWQHQNEEMLRVELTPIFLAPVNV